MMNNDYTLEELLKFLATCSGDEAIDFIHQFQCGGASICGEYAEEHED